MHSKLIFGSYHFNSRYEEVLDHHKIRYRKPYADKENQKPIDDSSENVATTATKPKPLGAKTVSDKVLGNFLDLVGQSTSSIF